MKKFLKIDFKNNLIKIKIIITNKNNNKILI